MENSTSTILLITFGWVAVVISLLFYPVIFVGVAFVIGTILSKDRFLHAIVMILSAGGSLFLAIYNHSLMIEQINQITL